jgi:mRNA interferase RelE/StbE
MSAWRIEYIKAAEKDLLVLDRSQQLQVLKAIEKVSANPLPASEGGFGKPLGSHSGNDLTGYLKFKLLKLGIWVVYKAIREGSVMKIIIISIRDDETVYKMAKERTK